MPTLFDPLRHARDSFFGARQLKENELYAVTCGLSFLYQTQITMAGKRRLKSETGASREVVRQFLQHQPPCTQRGSFWSKWCNPSGNQVGIDEHGTCSFARQKFARERSFPAPLGPAMMIMRGASSMLNTPTSSALLAGRTRHEMDNIRSASTNKNAKRRELGVLRTMFLVARGGIEPPTQGFRWEV